MSIINIFKCDVIRDKIVSHLKYEDMGIFFTCKDIYETLNKSLTKKELDNKQIEYTIRCFKDETKSIPIMTPIIYKIIEKISKCSVSTNFELIDKKRHLFLKLRPSYWGYNMIPLVLKYIENDLEFINNVNLDNPLFDYIYNYIYDKNKTINHNQFINKYDFVKIYNHILKFLFNTKINEEYIFEEIKKSPSNFENLKNHNLSNIEEIYREVFKLKSRYVNDCKLEYVLNHDIPHIDEIYKLAVISNGYNLKYIKKHDLQNIEEIYMLALMSIGNSQSTYTKRDVLKYIKNHSCPMINKIYKMCVVLDQTNLSYVQRHDIPEIEEVYMLSVSKYPQSLEYIKNHTVSNIFELYKISIEYYYDNNLNTFDCKWMKHYSADIDYNKYIDIFKHLPSNIIFIEKNPYMPNEDKIRIAKIFIDFCGSKVLRYINRCYPNLEEIYEYGLSKDICIIKYIKNHNVSNIDRIYSLAIYSDISLFSFVKNTRVSNFNELCSYISTRLEEIYHSNEISGIDERFFKKIIVHNLFNEDRLYEIAIRCNVRFLSLIPKQHPNIYNYYLLASTISEDALLYIKDHNIPGILEIYKNCINIDKSAIYNIRNHNIPEMDEIYKDIIIDNINYIRYLRNHNISTIEEIYKHVLNYIRPCYISIHHFENHSIPIIKEVYKIILKQNIININEIKNYKMITKDDIYSCLTYNI